MRPSGKKQKSVERVDSGDVADPTSAVTELAVETVNRHPKKSELIERSAPSRAKNQKATASKGTSTSRAKKGTASKEVGAELDETVAEAQDTLASTEVEVTSEEKAEEAVATENTHEDEEAEETQTSDDSQDAEEAEETVASQEKDEVEEADTTKDVHHEDDDTSADADAETEKAATLASDTTDEEEAVSETAEAEETDSSTKTKDESRQKERREKDSDVETETEIQDAAQSEKAVKADDGKEDKDQIEAETKVTNVVTHKQRKTKEAKKTSSDKAGQSQKTSHTDNAGTQPKHESEEHEDLPKLKAWALVGRLFRRLHASVIAFQGGSPEDVALIAQAPDDDQPSTGQVFSSLLLWSCLACLVAYFYSNRKEKPGSVDAEKQNEGAESFQEWKHGLFSCHEDPEVTLCACCCPAIRWALTLSYVPGLLSFWVAFFIYVCVELLGGLTAGTIGWVCLALLCTAYRQELRQKFNMEQQGGMTYITDAMTYLCCTCCAIAQEARHVEDALKSAHPALQESEEKSEAGQ